MAPRGVRAGDGSASASAASTCARRWRSRARAAACAIAAQAARAAGMNQIVVLPVIENALLKAVLAWYL
jgi:hypothetical protein